MSSSDLDDLETEHPKHFIVVTGSSAGGIDALGAFVSKLPPDIPASVVVAQHLSPQHESRLAEILKQRTSMPVCTIEGASELKPGTVYLVPPNHDIDIIDDSAALRLQVRRGPKPSIDRLLSTAAEVYRERVIAIIFSGLGYDGQLGARAVKMAGGTVIIQDPRTAGFPALPLSIPPTLVDMIAAPEAMGNIIADLLRAPLPPVDPGEKKLLRTLLTQLRERSGIDFSQYKAPTIMRRLSRLMVASGVTTISDYLSYLQRNPEGYQRLVTSFLIKVTEFFRDAALYDVLRDQILPKLLLEAAEHGRELRIWSAGTSTGEEAYSIAILCAELIRDDPNSVSVRIFATDINEQTIAFARRGIYSNDAVRNIPPGLLQRYFSQVDDHYEVSKTIRNMTVFGQHDLGQRAPFPRIDLCLCRNVLIYFTKELQTRALQLFAFALRDGGYLVLGKAESTTPLPQFFNVFNSSLKIYQREGERLMLPPTPLKDRAQGAPVPNFLRNMGAREHARLGHRPENPTSPSRDAIAAYIGGSAVGAVVVDRNYDIVAINSAARAMLQIHGVGVGSDLIHMLPSIGQSLRPMIDAVLMGETVEPVVVRSKDPGIDRWLQITCYSERGTMSTLGETVGIVIVDVTRYETKLQEVESTIRERDAAIGDHESRIDEMTARLRAVLTANDELTTMNADLRTYNEQLLIDTEEAASANEEIETLNEEMQATNEELETLNEELQATVEELNTTNDELEARSSELERANMEKQEQVERSESHRRSMILALESLAPASVLVGAHGDVYFAPQNLHDVVSAISPAERWWLEPSTIRLSDGRTYRTNVRLLDGEASDLRLITLEQVL